jgi:hypothetical protein
MTMVAFTCAVTTVDPAQAQRRDGNLLPQDTGGMITVAGCLVRGADVRGGHENRYVLLYPKSGPLNSVSEEKCRTDPGADAIELENSDRLGMNDSLVGRWVEVSGRLEKETSQDPDNLREMDARSFRMIPVVPPREALIAELAPRQEAAPPIVEESRAPALAAPDPVERRPVATTGRAERLPKTSSYLPALGWIGLLSLAGGVALGMRSRWWA